jgi:hypothetical protein
MEASRGHRPVFQANRPFFVGAGFMYFFGHLFGACQLSLAYLSQQCIPNEPAKSGKTVQPFTGCYRILQAVAGYSSLLGGRGAPPVKRNLKPNAGCRTLSHIRSDQRRLKAPNSKLQAPEKFQASITKAIADSNASGLVFAIWSFNGAWMLALGAFNHNPLKPT